jgi:hypothetical protein
MRPEDLTPEQRQRINDGCWYEIIRGICILLLVGIFLYGLPLLGSTAVIAMFVFNILGMILVARWITGFIYPNHPLHDLRRELEEEEK